MKDCGFDKQEALETLTPLVESNVKHILEDGPENALTGPVERGDVGTVEKHINCFPDTVSLSQAIRIAEKMVAEGEENVEEILDAMKAHIGKEPLAKIDYVGSITVDQDLLDAQLWYSWTTITR